jgi:hypothetical protein
VLLPLGRESLGQGHCFGVRILGVGLCLLELTLGRLEVCLELAHRRRQLRVVAVRTVGVGLCLLELTLGRLEVCLELAHRGRQLGVLGALRLRVEPVLQLTDRGRLGRHLVVHLTSGTVELGPFRVDLAGAGRLEPIELRLEVGLGAGQGIGAGLHLGRVVGFRLQTRHG